MSGSIQYAKHVRRFYVAWYEKGKVYKVYKYKGEYIYAAKIARKLLSLMQGDVEQGVFRIEKYTRNATDVIPYLTKWLESVKATLTPATYKDYQNSVKNHLAPFFEKTGICLHEIQHDTLMNLLSSINRGGKGKLNVMYCLHACLDYAWRSGRIQYMPPFPKKKAYQIVEPTIQWLPEARQEAIIEAMPVEHQPIFWWLKYHLRRPAEAMALLKEDFDGKTFTVRRSISAKTLSDRTKTGEVHIVPAVSVFMPFLAVEEGKQKRKGIISPFMFVCPSGKMQGKRYTHRTLNTLWHAACRAAGEDIDLYSGLKHSSCSQLINEYGYSVDQVQMATDHARRESVKKYAKVEVSARKAILEKTLISFPGKKLGRISKTNGGQDIETKA